jgi:hypothetical protein
MNRRKKGIQILKARAKKANSAPSNKPKYISKAEREKLAALESVESETASS